MRVKVGDLLELIIAGSSRRGHDGQANIQWLTHP